MSEFKPGDRVRFTEKSTYETLRGHEGTVTEIDEKRHPWPVVVKIDHHPEHVNYLDGWLSSDRELELIK